MSLKDKRQSMSNCYGYSDRDIKEVVKELKEEFCINLIEGEHKEACCPYCDKIDKIFGEFK